jgi:LPS export ABC transporter protein LptC
MIESPSTRNPLAPVMPFILLGLVLALMIGCGDSGEPAPTASPTTKKNRVPEQMFFDYRLIESTSGIRQWVLQSEKMLKFAGEKEVELVTIHMDFFKGGEHFSVLTADSGKANLETKNIHTWGNVIVVTDDGRKLETEDLYFNNETELIHNDVFNRFTREGDVLTGIGLEATPDLEYIEIKENVEVEVEDGAQGESGVR